MLRHELPEDYKEVEAIVYEAFESSSLYEFKDPTEHKLVAALRKTDGYVPELSIVVQEGWDIVGHALSTVVKIEGEQEKEVLALAPMSVKPVLQKSGVGLQLIMETIDTAKKLGYGAIVVLGHANYYPRFGFLQAKEFNIECNIDGVDDYLFVMELEKGYLEKNSKVIYPEVFFEEF
tara:strand:- start:6053 stop:6583 length:531 start_codon:yes stop_codon:yes gene_type:complete